MPRPAGSTLPAPLLLEVTPMSPFILLPDHHQQVLELLAQGFTPKQVASRRGLKYETVIRYQYEIRDYFDVNSNRQAVKRARAWGFVGPAGSPVGSGPLFVRRTA